MKALVKVPFHGHLIEVVEDGGDHWLPLRPLCDRFGLDVEGQRKKLAGCAWATTEEISAVADDGKLRTMTALNLRSFAGWLFSIKAGKVRLEMRESLIAYQREAADVLYHHLARGVASAADMEALRAEVIELRALVLARPGPMGLPVAGPVDARVYVLGPLQQIARKRARLDGVRWRSVYKTLDNDLREAVDYPLAREAKWAMLPREKLAAAHRKLTRWQHEVDDRLARVFDGAVQLPLRAAG